MQIPRRPVYEAQLSQELTGWNHK